MVARPSCLTIIGSSGDGRSPRIVAVVQRSRLHRSGVSINWIACETLWQSWRAEFGGDAADAVQAYQHFVNDGIEQPPQSPLTSMRHGWILGSAAFADRLKREIPAAPTPRGSPHAKALLLDRPEITMEEVLDAVAHHFKLAPGDLARAGEHALARSLAAWLCRRHTSAKLSLLSRRLGYARPESIPGIVRRVEIWRSRDAQVEIRLRTLEAMLRGRANAREKCQA